MQLSCKYERRKKRILLGLYPILFSLLLLDTVAVLQYALERIEIVAQTRLNCNEIFFDTNVQVSFTS